MKPVLQALLLADHVYRDAQTAKHVIAGTFTTFNVTRKQGKTPKTSPPDPSPVKRSLSGSEPMPYHQMGSPYVYISVTELRGTTKFQLRLVDLKEYLVLWGAELEVSCDDPLHSVECFVPLPPLNLFTEKLESSTTCALELLHEEEPLGSCRLVVNVTADESHRDE